MFHHIYSHGIDLDCHGVDSWETLKPFDDSTSNKNASEVSSAVNEPAQDSIKYNQDGSMEQQPQSSNNETGDTSTVIILMLITCSPSYLGEQKAHFARICGKIHFHS